MVSISFFDVVTVKATNLHAGGTRGKPKNVCVGGYNIKGPAIKPFFGGGRWFGKKNLHSFILFYWFTSVQLIRLFHIL